MRKPGLSLATYLRIPFSGPIHYRDSPHRLPNLTPKEIFSTSVSRKPSLNLVLQYAIAIDVSYLSVLIIPL